MIKSKKFVAKKEKKMLQTKSKDISQTGEKYLYPIPQKVGLMNKSQKKKKR